MKLTVKEALNIPRLNEGIVIAGEGGLNNIILCADILEVPDIYDWLIEGELLFTTGYSIGGIEDQIKLIKALYSKKSAGLIIKDKRFIENINSKVIETADELNIPIIMVPGDIPYIEMTHPLISQIVKTRKRNENMSKSIIPIITNSNKYDEKVLYKAFKNIKPSIDIKAPYYFITISYDSTVSLNKIFNITKVNLNHDMLSFFHNDKLNIIIFGHKLKATKNIYPLIFREQNNLNLQGMHIIISNEFKELSSLKNIFKLNNLGINYLEEYETFNDCPVRFNDIAIKILLKDIVMKKDNRLIIENIMMPFKGIDIKERQIMLETLEYFVKSGGNKSSASRNSYVHRNTFNYRMNKLINILENDLQEDDVIYKWRLILDIYRSIQKLNWDSKDFDIL